MGENIVDSAKELDAFIESKTGDAEQCGDLEETRRTTTLYILNIDQQVTTCYGGASFELVDTDHSDCLVGTAHFDITLGPANSIRLIEFLLALPNEPDEDNRSPRVFRETEGRR